MYIVPLVFSVQAWQEKIKTVWNIVQCLSRFKDKFLGIPGALQHSGSMYFFMFCILGEH